MPSILIADDFDLIRRGLRDFLQARCNLKVVAEAENGAEALERARQTNPDIAIVDFSMPDMSGIEFTCAIKRDIPDLKVLIYTVHVSEDLVVHAYHAGANAYIFKSALPSELYAAIDNALVGRRYFSPSLGEALIERCKKRNSHRQGDLTRREIDVVRLVAQGEMNKQIAFRLNISPKTVETHRNAVMRKLSLNTTADLVRYALRNQIAMP